MIEITGSATTGLPPEELFAFVADAENNPSWQTGMESCRWTSSPPIAVGSTYEQRARFLGKEIRSEFEVVELEPDRRIRIRTTRSTIPLDVTREVEPVDGGSRVVATIRGGPTGLLSLLDPLTAVMVRRSVRADYRRLEELLAHVEGDGDQPGAAVEG